MAKSKIKNLNDSLSDLKTIGYHFYSVKDWNECALWFDAALRKGANEEINLGVMFAAQECFEKIGQYGYSRYLGIRLIPNLFLQIVPRYYVHYV